MFQPLSLFIGLRYVRARQHKFFVSFITWVALAGVALGVAALIVVMHHVGIVPAGHFAVLVFFVISQLAFIGLGLLPAKRWQSFKSRTV